MPRGGYLLELCLRVLTRLKQPEAAVAVLHNEALPFYAQRSLKVENVL
jgi:hypothetical protein